MGATWLMTVIVVRLANFEAAGVFSLAITITAVFYCISIFGMRSFQVSDIANQFDDQVYFFSRICTSSIGMLGCFLYCFLSGYSLYQISVVLLYMMFKTVEAFSDVSYGYFQKYNHFDYIFYSLSFKGILSVALFTLALFVTQNLILALLYITFGTGCIYIFYDLKYTKRLVGPLGKKMQEGRKNVWLLLKATVLLMAIQLVSPVLIAIPRVYFESNYGSELFGYYSSISAPTVVISTFVSCAMMPFLPRFAEYYCRSMKKECFRLIAGTVGLTVIFGTVCYLIGLWLGEFVLAILYTPDILKYSDILGDIIVSTTCSALVMCLNSFFIATRKIKTLAMLSLIGCIFSYFLTPILIQQFHMKGICYTLTISQLIQSVCMLMFACIEINAWRKENYDV